MSLTALTSHVFTGVWHVLTQVFSAHPFQIFPCQMLLYLCARSVSGLSRDSHKSLPFIATTTTKLTKPYLAWKATFYTLLVAITVRVIIFGAVIFAGVEPQHYQHYEPLLGSFWTELNFVSAPILFAASLLPLFVLYIDLLVYHLFGGYFLTIFYGIVVTNHVNHFVHPRSSNHHLHSPPSQLLTGGWHGWRTVWAQTGEVCAEECPKQLSRLFPPLSARVRARAAVIVEYGNRFIAALVTVVFLIFGSLSTIHLVLVWPDWTHITTLRTQAHIFYDLTCFSYALWNAVRLSLFTLFYLSAVAYVHQTNLAECTTLIRRSVHSGKHGIPEHRSDHRPPLLSLLLARYGRDRVATFLFARRLNTEVVSRIFLVVIITHLPVNIFMITTLVYWSLLSGEIVLLVGLIALQTSLVLTLCVICLRLSGSLYAGGGQLFRAQPQLDGSNEYRAKLKLMTVYELVCTRAKFHFTLGPCGRISKRSLYEFLYIYSASLIFAFRMFQRTSATE